MKVSKEWNQGYSSYGEGNEKNPYTLGSKEWEDWIEGYEAAQSDYEEELSFDD